MLKYLILVSILIFSPFSLWSSNTPQAREVKAKWTCIIYFAGDNFLDWFVQQNLDELRKLDSNHNVRAVVLADKTDNQGYLYEVKKECLAEIPLWRIEQSWDGKELNTGDPQTLSTFACWAVESFPAENYLLLLGGYGEGWMGLLHDFNDGAKNVDILTLEELELALKKVTESIRKISDKNRIEILGLDACYMGMVEVISQVSSYAKYVIASENEESLDGWPYDEVLKAFLEDPFKKTPEIASRIADAYIDSATSSPKNLANILTISVVDAERFEKAIEPLKGLVPLLKDINAREIKRIIDIDRLTPSFTVSAHIGGRYVPYSRHYDLGEFVRIAGLKFRDRPELSQRAQELKDAVRGAIIKERHQNLPEKTPQLSGLAIFGMGTEIELYKKLAFSQNSHWSDFVEDRMKALENLFGKSK